MVQIKLPSPIHCEEMKDLLDRLLHNQLDVETRGRMKGHLLGCDSCMLSFSEAVDEAINKGLIVLEKAPPAPTPPPSILEAMGVCESGGEVIWSKLKALVGDFAWALKEVNNLCNNLAKSARLFGAQIAGPEMGVTMGEGDWTDSEEVEVMDPEGGEVKVRFGVDQPPTVTREGIFQFQMRSDDPRVKNGALFCTISGFEGIRVKFEGKVQSCSEGMGWEISFQADGFPEEEEDVVISKNLVELSFQMRD